jgi:hypothetical protein
MAELTRYRDTRMDGIFSCIFSDIIRKVNDPIQLELPLHHTLCKHELYDNEGDKGMGWYCKKCDYFDEVYLINPMEGLTMQECYEYLQEVKHLKK